MKKALVPSILVAVVLLAIGVIAEAQEPKVPRIGVIFPAFPSVSAPFMAVFREGLHDLGYTEGKNIVIEDRYADGKEDRLPALAAELVHLKVDIIMVGEGMRLWPPRMQLRLSLLSWGQQAILLGLA